MTAAQSSKGLQEKDIGAGGSIGEGDKAGSRDKKGLQNLCCCPVRASTGTLNSLKQLSPAALHQYIEISCKYIIKRSSWRADEGPALSLLGGPYSAAEGAMRFLPTSHDSLRQRLRCRGTAVAAADILPLLWSHRRGGLSAPHRDPLHHFLHLLFCLRNHPLVLLQCLSCPSVKSLQHRSSECVV